jgi:hypothetical protein
MIIIGADYHPSFQQIALTGEFQERRLEHRGKMLWSLFQHPKAITLRTVQGGRSHPMMKGLPFSLPVPLLFFLFHFLAN